MTSELESIEADESSFTSEERNLTLGVFDCEIEAEKEILAGINPKGITSKEYQEQIDEIVRRCMVMMERKDE